MRAAAASSAAAGVRALRRGRESSAAPATHGEAPQPQLLACYGRRWASKLIFQALSLISNPGDGASMRASAHQSHTPLSIFSSEKLAIAGTEEASKQSRF
ncbi:hypothetical protein PVAP13_3KG520105 [Panicum virgatum]|uniref:Uncharacterized protein n=1 Tax=Panicum virgatum TaxID=38727 RepID=A0A8T0V025_PANVG|nr:hypothetical protein PVAP13_3KG520105 [Panicum virgatum]